MADRSDVAMRWVLMVMAIALATTIVCGDDNPGTTQHLKEIFIGRCYDYKEIRYKKMLKGMTAHCESQYEKFLSAFSMKPPCGLTMAHYQDFMISAKQELPEDKVMFWSGVKDLVHEYALDGGRYVTLEDTLIGYLVDSLVWCGQTIEPGINYIRCPSWSDCPSEASESFWASASKTFAESARGLVTVMMDGSNPQKAAYRKNSFFGKYELPYLNTAHVNKVIALLTRPLDSPAVETCKKGSMVTLRQDVLARGLQFDCVDEPDAIIHLLCVADPDDRACHLAQKYILPGPGNASNGNGSDNVQKSSAFNAKPADRFA